MWLFMVGLRGFILVAQLRRGKQGEDFLPGTLPEGCLPGPAGGTDLAIMRSLAGNRTGMERSLVGHRAVSHCLARPLESINLRTKETELASYERSDVCAIAAASCIVENVVAFEIARAMVDKFGGDSLEEMQARWKLFHEMAGEHWG